MKIDRRYNKGLTLMELLVAIAIIVIILTVGVQGVGLMISQTRMATTTNNLNVHLQLARSEAIKRAVHVILCPSRDGISCNAAERPSTWHTGYMVFADWNGNNIRDQGTVPEPIIRVVSGAADARITINANRNRFVYQQDGTAGGSPGTFSLCDSTERVYPQALIVSNVGRPRVSGVRPGGGAIECGGSER